jgi:small subunit ribosomal protein S1
VNGRVIDVRPTEVVVDIGYKSKASFRRGVQGPRRGEAGRSDRSAAQRLEDDQGMVVVSKRRAEQQRNWDRVLANYQSKAGIIKGPSRAASRVASLWMWASMRSCPVRRWTWSPIRAPARIFDRELDFKIIKINRERRNIVVSRRELMEDRRREQKKLC